MEKYEINDYMDLELNLCNWLNCGINWVINFVVYMVLV